MVLLRKILKSNHSLELDKIKKGKEIKRRAKNEVTDRLTDIYVFKHLVGSWCGKGKGKTMQEKHVVKWELFNGKVMLGRTVPKPLYCSFHESLYCILL